MQCLQLKNDIKSTETITAYHQNEKPHSTTHTYNSQERIFLDKYLSINSTKNMLRKTHDKLTMTPAIIFQNCAPNYPTY